MKSVSYLIDIKRIFRKGWHSRRDLNTPYQSVDSPKLKNHLLGIAFPLDEEEFYEAYAGGPYSDFINKQCGNKPEDCWENRYKSVSEELTALWDLAKEKDIEVQPYFKLEDFEGISRFQVVTLFAHWRDHRISQQDVNLEALRVQLTKKNDLIQERLSALMSTDANGTFPLDVDALNEVLEKEALFFEEQEIPDVIPVLLPSELSYRNRKVLDEWCPHCFKPGNLLELHDLTSC